MESTALFSATLGLKEPWKVSDIRFDLTGEIHFDLSCEVKRLGCPALF